MTLENHIFFHRKYISSTSNVFFFHCHVSKLEGVALENSFASIVDQVN